MSSAEVPSNQLTTKPKFPRWVKTAATVVLAVILMKVLELVWGGFSQILRATDKFVWDGVRSVAPFHVCVVFYREFMQGISSQTNGNLGTDIALAFGAMFQTIGVIIKEGPASILTAAIVLFIGISGTFDRKADHPVLTTLFLGPIVGGIFVYLLWLLMAVFSAVVHAGAATVVYIGSTIPLVKDCVLALVEEKQHEIASRAVDQVAQKIR